MLYFEPGSQPETKVHAERHSANRPRFISYTNPVTKAIKFDVLGIRARQAPLHLCNDLKTTSSTHKQLSWTLMLHTEVHHQQNIHACVSGRQVLYTHINWKITACLWKGLLLRQNLFFQRSVLDSPLPPSREVSQLFGVKTNSPSVATSWANTRNISSCPASADAGTWSQGIVFSFSLEL